MRIGLQNTDWGYIGAKLAQADDNDQAEFFKALAAEFKTYDTSYQIGMQMASIRAKMDEASLEVLSELF